MTDLEHRDHEHATNLKIARELIDFTWSDGEGCAIEEAQLRQIGGQLLIYEKALRERIKIRKAPTERRTP